MKQILSILFLLCVLVPSASAQSKDDQELHSIAQQLLDALSHGDTMAWERNLHRDFLLQARPEEQAAIVRALRRARPKVIVRWTAPESAQPEPNRRGRPSGSRALDDYLGEAYRPDARYGDYELLVPR